ncbi:hypothetical protein WMY93_020919 [Mugilogobius chulae]|uniref:Golgin A3 n=1 Tax=Mugilogobius chulae TaxID=88201 RepID=A0AAW0NJ90_9GOBI
MQQKVMVEAYRRDASSKDQLINELKSTKKRLMSEVKDLKQSCLEHRRRNRKQRWSRAGCRRRWSESRSNNQHGDTSCGHPEERDELEGQVESLRFDRSQLASVTEENEGLRKQVEQMESEAKKRLQEALTEKETAEAELVKLKAQVSDGGNSQALQEKIKALQAELKAVNNSKSMLEKELQEVITLTSNELEEYQEKVLELEDELQESRNSTCKARSRFSSTKLTGTSLNDLKEQVAAAKAEAAHNRRHYRAAMLELSEIKKELQAKEDLIKVLQNEAQQLHVQDEQHVQEVSKFQEELSEAQSQIQILQKRLDEELAKQPLTNQEVEDLKWEVEQKQREIEAQKQQVEMMEQCHHRELENLQTALQGIKVELETVQEDLSSARKDKFMLQAKVGELRNSMKTLLLQNQQLKQNRMRKRMELKSEGNPSNPVTPVKIPDCPVPASLLDELLKPSTSVNKEPLNNLHNCLRQLKEEMDSLQRQMEEHTVTVHESINSWPNAQQQPGEWRRRR